MVRTINYRTDHEQGDVPKYKQVDRRRAGGATAQRDHHVSRFEI